MSKEELKEKIIELVKNVQLGTLATIDDTKPWARYMVVRHDEELVFYTNTFAQSRKVEQIKKNNNVHLVIGGDPHNWKAPYLNMEAKAELLSAPQDKEKYWEDMLRQYFQGPQDPNFIVIKILPTSIEYVDPETHKPQIYKVD
jgi:general stress protein 26